MLPVAVWFWHTTGSALASAPAAAPSHVREGIAVDNLMIFLNSIDFKDVPQRSTLQTLTRLVRSGWEPEAELRQQIVAFARRGLAGFPRLRHRAAETLAALGTAQSPSGGENAAERILCDVALDAGNRTSIRDRGTSPLSCPSCRSLDVHPSRGDRWVCSGCGAGLMMKNSGRLHKDNELARRRSAVRR
ncbi:MAG: hypothetical protein SH850_00835 [Planctomycetaceae bacterium]|nr:hypothetical protein [Planctomycetaceae bacterium]